MKNDMQVSEVPIDSQTIVGGRVSGLLFETIDDETKSVPVLVGSVYIPTVRSRRLRNTTFNELKRVVGRFAGEGLPMIWMGDFNCSGAKLARKVAGWGLGLEILPVRGAAGTYPIPGGRASDIDHILVNQTARSMLHRGVVRQKEGISTTGLYCAGPQAGPPAGGRHPKGQLDSIGKSWRR